MIRSYKNKVTQIEIIQAAQKLVQQEKIPTIAKVRDLLNGRGSESTILKYLTMWKQQCFKQTNDPTDQHKQDRQILEEKENLEQSLNKQLVKNEYYAQELINAEKTNIFLKEKLHQLQTNNQELQLELKEVKAIKITLEQVNQEIQTRLDANNNDTIKNQQLLIDELRAELKELNIKSMKAIQETSSSAHELLMQEKITNMNLQEKINTFNKQITELQKQLQITNNMLAAKQQPLLRQIEWQRKIIQNHIGFEKLRLIEEEELKLKFNANEACYGN